MENVWMSMNVTKKVRKARLPRSGAGYLTLGIDLVGVPCLVVGGGVVGTRKALKLVDAGGDVTVIAPRATERLEEAAAAGMVDLRKEAYAAGSLERYLLIVAATSDPILNASIGREAGESGKLCCLASPGHLSTAIFPATSRVDGLTVSVHSDGSDCVRAKAACEELARILSSAATEGAVQEGERR